MNEIKHQYFCTKCGTERDGLLDHPAIGIGGYSWNCPRCNGPVDSREVVMSEAPKKIWVPEVWVDCLGWEETPGEEIPYIRADIVDELVEALKICLAGNGYDFDERPAEAALAKLEESHE